MLRFVDRLLKADHLKCKCCQKQEESCSRPNNFDYKLNASSREMNEYCTELNLIRMKKSLLISKVCIY